MGCSEGCTWGWVPAPIGLEKTALRSGEKTCVLPVGSGEENCKLVSGDQSFNFGTVL